MSQKRKGVDFIPQHREATKTGKVHSRRRRLGMWSASFSNLSGQLLPFIPIPQHNDPEFCRFTYGDVVSREADKVQTKGRSLMNLREGDMLVFYAGFDSEEEVSYAAIGRYFCLLYRKGSLRFRTGQIESDSVFGSESRFRSFYKLKRKGRPRPQPRNMGRAERFDTGNGINIC